MKFQLIDTFTFCVWENNNVKSNRRNYPLSKGQISQYDATMNVGDKYVKNHVYKCEFQFNTTLSFNIIKEDFIEALNEEIIIILDHYFGHDIHPYEIDVKVSGINMNNVPYCYEYNI